MRMHMHMRIVYSQVVIVKVRILVCMHVCMYICVLVHVCMRIRMYVCIYTKTYAVGVECRRRCEPICHTRFLAIVNIYQSRLQFNIDLF
jgi:hypothetical protein